MKTLVVVTVSSDKELAGARALNARFAPDFRIVTALDIDFGKIWAVPDANKHTVEWTRRFLEWFLSEPYDVLLKVDPDTRIKKLPVMPAGCDVAGDFRITDMGWVWFGGFQYYTRSAVKKILADAQYTGGCLRQDVALAACVRRLGLRANNMAEVDCWCAPGALADVTHLRKNVIPRFSAATRGVDNDNFATELFGT